MTRLAWQTCGLLWVVLAAACGSSYEARDSNSNWLRQCGDRDRCGDGQICACGVCTLACIEDDACQREGAADATCVTIAAAQCAGAGLKRGGAVCAFSCRRDSDCEDGLSCASGACVQTMSIARDGGTAVDAGPDPLDQTNAAARLDGSLPDRPDGAVTGDPVRPAIPPKPPARCEQTGCADGLTCTRNGCRRPWNGMGCTAAPEQRAACGTDDSCAQGQICHRDGTCIVPGECDRLGETTLAAVGDVRELVLTAEGVFVLDFGSKDALGNDRSDGSIARVGLDGAVDVRVSGLYRPRILVVDGERLFWIRGQVGESSLWVAARDGSNAASITAVGNFECAQNGTDLYFESESLEQLAAGDWNAKRLFRYGKTSKSVEQILDDPLPSSDPLAVDSQYLYVQGAKLPLAGGERIPWLASDRLMGFTLGPDHGYFTYYGGDDFSLNSIAKSDGMKLVLAREKGTINGKLRPHRDHLYYPLQLPETVSSPQQVLHFELRRAPLVPTGSEPLATFERTGDAPWLPFTVGDSGLYWVDDHRLLRRVIEDYVGSPAPAQGASVARASATSAAIPG